MNQSQRVKEDFIKDYRLKIGNSIRIIREKRGYSQDHLAEIMEVNRSTISKIENGKFNLSMDYLSKFSWFLDFELLIVDGNKMSVFESKKNTKNNTSGPKL